MGRTPLGVIILLSTLLLTASTVLAGSSENPEIEDPSGDAVHFEFQIQEPSLDVTKVWFTWHNQTLQVHLLIEDVQTFGPDGTQDPGDAGTSYDVYWTMDGEEYTARLAFCTPMPGAGCWIPSTGEAAFLAGQTMQIERQPAWAPMTRMHGDLIQQSEGVHEPGAPGHILINIDPADVGNPGPGSTLEAPAFSTWVDHHNPGAGDADTAAEHHPGHVDQNDQTGDDFTIPTQSEADTDANQSGDPAGNQSDEQPIPTLAPLIALSLLLAASLLRRESA